jgi:hypothetical protein
MKAIALIYASRDGEHDEIDGDGLEGYNFYNN